VAAARQRAAARIEGAPWRRAFPDRWTLALQAPLQGRAIYLRRTDAFGQVSLLGHRFAIAPLWVHRLVRAEVDLTAGRIRFHALRRRQPAVQPLLAEVAYAVPNTPFRE
jgi:hypothetical protein